MSAAIEREIRHLLNETGSADLAARELIERWRKDLFTPDQQRAVAQFLLDAGYASRLLEELARLFAERRAIPWAQFVEALAQARVVLDEDQLQAFFDGLEEQDAWDEVLRSRRADRWHKSFAEKRTQLKARQALMIAEKRSALRERVAFFRANRMTNEEIAALEQLRKVFPDDPDAKDVQQDLEERWARDVLAGRSVARTDVTRELYEKARQLTPEQTSIKDLIFSQCLEIASAKPHAAYDLALLLVFMEFYDESIEVLDRAPPSRAADWLRLELQLKARQYVTVLDEANRLEIAYAGDPESTFSVIYARARALWGLGQSGMAIDLMRSIVSIRPHYKSAMSLLADWSGGSP